MSPPDHPQHPALTPALCLQTDALRSFLRLSRAAIDDPITQHLASMNRPSEQPFDTASFSSDRATTPSRRSLPPQSCAAFVSHVLFPAWAARARVLEYCAGVTRTGTETQTRGSLTGKAPNSYGSSAERNQWGGTLKGGTLAIGARVVGPEAASQRRDEHSPTTAPMDEHISMTGLKVIDERLDPYSARDYTDETSVERIARVIREEKTVESIVRSRSWGVIRDRCGNSIDDWEDGMKKWEDELHRTGAREAVRRQEASQELPRSDWRALWSGSERT